jgi:hypothetical protein
VLADASFIGFIPVPELAARPFAIAGWNVPDIGTVVRTLADQVAWFADPDGNTLSLTGFAAP